MTDGLQLVSLQQAKQHLRVDYADDDALITALITVAREICEAMLNCPVDADTCPLSVKQAMLLLIGHLYANREATTDKPLTLVPLAVDALLSPYKFYGAC